MEVRLEKVRTATLARESVPESELPEDTKASKISKASKGSKVSKTP
jgi:hypothetical protein